MRASAGFALAAGEPIDAGFVADLAAIRTEVPSGDDFARALQEDARRRVGTLLHDLPKLRQLLGREPRPGPGMGLVAQAGQALDVVAMHPVT